MPSLKRPFPPAKLTNSEPRKKPSYKVKLNINVPENLAKELAKHKPKRASAGLRPNTTIMRGKMLARRPSTQATQHVRETNAKAVISQTPTLEVRRTKLREDLAQLDAEETEILQQTIKNKDEEIISLAAELAKSIKDNEIQVEKANEMYQEAEKQLLEQKREIERLKVENAQHSGLKRKLAEFLSDMGITTEEKVAATEHSNNVSLVTEQARVPQEVHVDRTAPRPPQEPAEVTSLTSITPVGGTRHSPWTVQDHESHKDEADDMGETITVRVAPKTEPDSPTTKVGADQITGSISIGKTKSVSGAESNTDGARQTTRPRPHTLERATMYNFLRAPPVPKSTNTRAL